MKKCLFRGSMVLLFSVVIVMFGVSSALADSYELDDWAFYFGQELPGGGWGGLSPNPSLVSLEILLLEDMFAGSSFNYSTNLGTIKWSVTNPNDPVVGAPIDYSFGAFFDYSINYGVEPFASCGSDYAGDEAGAGAFDSAGIIIDPPSSVPSGYSWELGNSCVGGEPRFSVSNGYLPLDNTNSVGEEDNEGQNDVSMAIGWNFTLNPQETASIVLDLSMTEPTDSLFYLLQRDDGGGAPDPNSTITGELYLSVKLDVVPEPGTLLLLGLGLVGLLGFSRKFKK